MLPLLQLSPKLFPQPLLLPLLGVNRLTRLPLPLPTLSALLSLRLAPRLRLATATAVVMEMARLAPRLRPMPLLSAVVASFPSLLVNGLCRLCTATATPTVRTSSTISAAVEGEGNSFVSLMCVSDIYMLYSDRLLIEGKISYEIPVIPIFPRPLIRGRKELISSRFPGSCIY